VILCIERSGQRCSKEENVVAMGTSRHADENDILGKVAIVSKAKAW